MKIWPWSKFEELRVDIRIADERAEKFRLALNEVDPSYWHRKVLEHEMRRLDHSPFGQFYITNAKVPD